MAAGSGAGEYAETCCYKAFSLQKEDGEIYHEIFLSSSGACRI